MCWWLQELHRDFIAAVFDMGLKKADPSRLKGILPKKDRCEINTRQATFSPALNIIIYV